MKYFWLLLCFFGLSITANAQTEENITLNDGELEIPYLRYAAFADDAPILLWLPSSRGTSSQQALTAIALGDIDIETWAVDLHMGYFIDPTRSSVQYFKAEDIANIIQKASEQTSQKIYVMTNSSGAKPALKGIARYQQRVTELKTPMRLGGAILFHPALSTPSTEPGTAVGWAPIATHSTLPIYYFQPSISTKQWHSAEIIKALETGGSSVFFHPLKGVSAGFHMRPDDDLSDADLIQRERLPQDIKRAIRLLSLQKNIDVPASLAATAAPANRRYGLKTLASKPARAINLDNLATIKTQIEYDQHAASLISFWASWCEPCIKELPALRRLQEDYAHKGLNIVTINVGETIAEMQSALTDFKMQDYTNLRDPQGETMKAWNVYGFPTNFLVTQAGMVSHGSFGAVEWDDAEVRNVIDQLLEPK